MTNLRSSDVVSRYSDSQFIIMLPNADMENSRRVMQRLIGACSERYPGEPDGLSWQIRPLEIL
ncbi:MAG: diguanylate cyclase [Clostridia bacterium]|nr:diguanylate cyclase [Clostridia bacterium]